MFSYSKYILLLIFSLFFTSNLYALPDNCDNIIGHWKGFWAAPYARCDRLMDATITKKNNAIELNAALVVNHLPTSCHNANIVLTGTCLNGHIEIQYGSQVIQGDIEGNIIQIRPTDQYIKLEKISE